MFFIDGGGVPPHYDTTIYYHNEDYFYYLFLTRAHYSDALCVSQINITIILMIRVEHLREMLYIDYGI